MSTRGSQTLTWDVENRPVSVTSGNSTNTFIYDGDGVRVKKTEGGQVILYVNACYEKNLTSGNVTTYYYLGDRLVAMRQSTTLTYIHQDHLTGTSVVSDSSGNLVSSIKYYPFGECRNSQGNPGTDKLFTGQRLDGTGLYYYGARYYDTSIGRFISADIIVQKPGNPQCWNRYSYTLNNPLKYTDPSGYVVDCGGDKTLSAAWQLFRDTCPDQAKMMDASNTVFTFSWGKVEGNTIAETSNYTVIKGGTLDNVSITIDTRKINVDREGTEGVTWIIAHESVHAIGALINPNMPATFWEEALAMQFQYKVGQAIGYDPPYSECWLPFIFNTHMQKFNRWVNEIMQYELTGERQTMSSSEKGILNIMIRMGYFDPLDPWAIYFYSEPQYMKDLFDIIGVYIIGVY
jgi:RHS repeat-associated protein